MKLRLVAKGVISSEKLVIEYQSNSSQMSQVLNHVIPRLLNKQPKNFKSFLQVMEQSDDPLLEETAMRLG